MGGIPAGLAALKEFAGGAVAGFDAAVHVARGDGAGVFASEEEAAIEFGLGGDGVDPGVLADEGVAVAGEGGGDFGPVHGAGFAVVGGFGAREDGVEFAQVGGGERGAVGGGAGAADEVGDDAAGAVLAAAGFPDILEGGNIGEDAAIGGMGNGLVTPDAFGEAAEGFDVVAVAHFADAAFFGVAEFEVVDACDIAQYGEGEGEDDAVVGVGGGAFFGEEFEAELAVDLLDGAKALAETEVDFVLDGAVEGVGEGGIAALDAIGFVAFAEDLEAFGGVGVDEVDEVEAGLAFDFDAEFGLVGGDEETDGPGFDAG